MSNCFGYLAFLTFLTLFLISFRVITMLELRKAKKEIKTEIEISLSFLTSKP